VRNEGAECVFSVCLSTRLIEQTDCKHGDRFADLTDGWDGMVDKAGRQAGWDDGVDGRRGGNKVLAVLADLIHRWLVGGLVDR